MRSRLLKTFLVLVCLFSLLTYVRPARADFTLENANDVVFTLGGNVSNVPHEFSFTEPLGSIINSTDYVVISMPNYIQINISNISVTGSFVYGDTTGLHASVANNNIYLTNLSVVQGSSIHINGITAQNPQYSSQFEEQITVATSASMTTIKNQSNISPSIFNLYSNQSVTASAEVDPYAADVTLSGYAYPGDFITVTENSAVIGTTSPDGTGYFQVSLTGLTPGTHTFSIYGIDANNNTTAVTTISLFTPAYETTNYQNIVLSPIVSLNPNQINQGDSITFTGETVPNSNVTISINSPLVQISTTSDNNGNYTYTYTQTATMQPGQYTMTANVQLQSSYQSLESLPANFTVLAANSSGSGSGPKPSCNISQGDLNCDGHVNLIDFSILMYYWGTNSALADINGDGVVNLTDFSIMMFYFGS